MRTSVIKEHVVKLFKEQPMCHGNMCLKSFADPLLAENVETISISDTECVVKSRKVVHAFQF